jgi:hypothetical protein
MTNLKCPLGSCEPNTRFRIKDDSTGDIFTVCRFNGPIAHLIDSRWIPVLDVEKGEVQILMSSTIVIVEE